MSQSCDEYTFYKKNSAILFRCFGDYTGDRCEKKLATSNSSASKFQSFKTERMCGTCTLRSCDLCEPADLNSFLMGWKVSFGRIFR